MTTILSYMIMIGIGYAVLTAMDSEAEKTAKLIGFRNNQILNNF